MSRPEEVMFPVPYFFPSEAIFRLRGRPEGITGSRRENELQACKVFPSPATHRYMETGRGRVGGGPPPDINGFWRNSTQGQES